MEGVGGENYSELQTNTKKLQDFSRGLIYNSKILRISPSKSAYFTDPTIQHFISRNMGFRIWSDALAERTFIYFFSPSGTYCFIVKVFHSVTKHFLPNQNYLLGDTRSTPTRWNFRDSVGLAIAVPTSIFKLFFGFGCQKLLPKSLGQGIWQLLLAFSPWVAPRSILS